MIDFGITNKHLRDRKFLITLTSHGSIPAYFHLKDIIRGQKDEFSLTKRYTDLFFKRYGISLSNDRGAFSLKEKAKLSLINDDIAKEPMRALISPINNPELNKKLFDFRVSEKIGDYQSFIKTNNISKFKKRNLNITSADINKIKQSIIWLNWFLYHSNKDASVRPKRLQLCLSDNAIDILALEGLQGLYKKSKKNKRALKKYFKELAELDTASQMKLLSAMSLDLNTLLNIRFSPKRVENLFNCYNYFESAYPSITKYRRHPNYFMYNPNILRTQKTLKELHDTGYSRMQNMKFLDKEFKRFLLDKNLYNCLSINFSKL